MKHARWLLFAALALSPMMALGQISENCAALTAADILNKLHSINQAEISKAGLVLDRSKNAEVRKFAARMVRDHGKADQLVSALATTKGLALADAHSDNHGLAELKGGPFDRAYIDGMVTGHRDALEFLTHADAQSSDAAVRGLIKKLRPVVAQHEELARQIQVDRPPVGG